MGDVVEADLRDREGMVECGAGGGSSAEIRTCHQRLFLQRGVPVQEDPSARVDTRGPGGPHRHHHTRGRLVDLIARDEKAGEGVGDKPIGVGDGHELVRRALGGGGRVRVRGRHPRHRREELAHAAGVGIPVEAEAMAAGVLQQGVLRHRRAQAVTRLRQTRDAAQPEAAILELSADLLAEIGALVGGLGHQVPDRRDDLGAEDDRTR